MFIDRSGIIEEFKKANNAFGIDISEYNDAANLDDLKKNGISFVFLTATHGTNKVQSFDSYWKDSRTAGLTRGAIHLGTTTDPVAQANLFVDTVVPEKTDLLILRIDTTQQLQLMTAADAIAFIARVNEKTGRNPIIYANLSFLERLSRDDQKRLSAYPLWIANYRVQEAKQLDLGSWNSWRFWQLTVAYPLKGQGSFGYNIFNGSPAALADFVRDPR